MSDAPTNYLPILVRDGGVNDWERKFCATLIRQTKQGRPLSGKQANTLSRIVDAFKARAMSGDVIE